MLPLASFKGEQIPRINCWICGRPHTKQECPKWTVPQPQAPTTTVCSHSKKHGHTNDQCYELYPNLCPSYPQGRGGGGREGKAPRGDIA